jgi:hypothetical protein
MNTPVAEQEVQIKQDNAQPMSELKDRLKATWNSGD